MFTCLQSSQWPNKSMRHWKAEWNLFSRWAIKETINVLKSWSSRPILGSMDFSCYGNWNYPGQLCPKHRSCPAKRKICRSLRSNRYVQTTLNTSVVLTDWIFQLWVFSSWCTLSYARFGSNPCITFSERRIFGSRWPSVFFWIGLLLLFLWSVIQNFRDTKFITDLVSLAGIGLGVFARRARIATGTDHCWIGTVHCYGRSNPLSNSPLETRLC